MPEDHRRYSFPPLARRGVLLGLQTGQLATLLFGAAGALIINRALPAPAGAGVALLMLASCAVIALWPRCGRPLVSWLPVAAAWVSRRSLGPSMAPQLLAGRGRVTRQGRVPAQGRRTTRRRSARGTWPAGIALAEAEGGPGDQPFGMICDRRSGTCAAVVPVQGRSFVLLDVDAQIVQLEAWRAVLGTMGRPGSPIRRLQWVHCTAPAGVSRPVGAWRDANEAPGGERAGWEPARQSYRQLLTDERLGPPGHDAWLVLAVGATQRPGLPSQRSLSQLRRELRLLQGQLRNADLQAGPPLGLDGLGALMAAAFRPERSGAKRPHRHGPWPMASDEGWSAYRADGTWHATFWIAEWPRIEVNPDFLSPLLLCDGRRTVSVVMAPVAADRAAREVRAARAADAADEELRNRAGFLPSVRRRREADGVIRREAELAEGHADYRFSGYVTVTAADRDGLDEACVETEQVAERAHLELRRLYGRQAEAFTWTLPLARGLS